MSVDRVKDGLTRRALGQAAVGVATAGYGAAIAYPVVRYLLSGAASADEGIQVSEVSLGDPEAIKPGTGKNFAFGSKPALVVRDAAGQFQAFIATCSHHGCTVAMDAVAHLIRCPCHGGTYDPATGKNVGGPPPRPLTRLVAVVDGDKLIVRRAEG